jgi:iron complex transport system ATP-binding protein
VSGVVLTGVSVSYGPVAAVRGFDLDVATGEWVALVGPNGAGKSSILRAVVRLARFAGSIRIGEENVNGLGGAELARRVAIVLQSPQMPGGMTVSQYILLGRSPHLGYLGKEGRRDRAVVADILERLSLRDLAERPLEQLSGGERQRAAIGRALAQDAPVLLVDEPTSSLDVARQQEVLELIDSIRATHGLTVIAAMHDLTLAGQYADRLALLVAGELVMTGAAAEVLTESMISTHYGANVRIVQHDGEGRAVVPVRARHVVEVRRSS